MRWPLLAQAPGDSFAIDTVHPIEVLSDVTRFIGLDRAYKVPHQRQVLQFMYLLQGLLHIVFAEVHQAAGMGCPNILRGTGLAHGNHKNVTIAILAFFCAAPYSLKQLCYIVEKQLFVHGANVSGFGVWVT
jgi:hypothetical protein